VGARFLRPQSALVGATAASVAVIAGFAVFMVAKSGTPMAKTGSDVTQSVAALLAGGACLRAARRREADARGWALLGAAAFTWAAASTIWTIYGLTRDYAYPFPAIPDIGFLGYAVPAIAGLLAFPRPTTRTVSWARASLDTGLIVASVAFVSWALVLGTVYRSPALNPLSQITALAYPIVDVAVGSVVLTLGMRRPAGARMPWLLLGGGLSLLTFTDSLFVYRTSIGMATTGTLVPAGWVAAFLMIALATLVPVRPTAERARSRNLFQETLPYLPLLTALVVATNRRVGLDDPVLFWSGVVVLVVFIIRQAFIVIEVDARTAERNTADERFRSLVQSSDDAIVSKTTDGLITSWNPGAERLYGYAPDEVMGRPIALLVPPHRRQQEGEILDAARRGLKVNSYETERVRKDGTLVEVALTVSAIFDGDVVSGISAIGRDVTERKRADAALRDAHNQALEATRLKSDFLATMSHEIRTPMNGVIGLTGLLLDSELNTTQRHHAEGVRASGEALLSIINDILDFSKIEAGKLELETVDFDLGYAMESVAALVADSAQAKGLELVAACDPEVPAGLRGDVGRLRQVLLNLATNAVKFTSSGEVVLRAGLVEEATPELVMVRFEVRDRDRDRGGGRREPVRPLLAGRCFHHPPLRRHRAGSGHLPKAEPGNGRQHRPGQRTRCRDHLLGAAAVQPVLDSCMRTQSIWQPCAARQEDVGGRRQRDQPPRADVPATGLGCSGRPGSGRRGGALELLRHAVAEANPYVAALVDMAMPGMDGMDLARIVTSDPELAATRLLLLSSVDVDAEAAARAGFLDRLTKPVRLSQLYGAVAHAIVPPDPVRKSGNPALPAVAPGSRGTLLIVEDHAINQEVAKGIAAKLGYLCDVAGDGIEALAALGRRSYDAVLMDCHMPEMDGFQATAEIRRREGGRRHIPIIAMTAAALVEDHEKCLAVGMDDYLSKPVKGGQLDAVLSRWLDNGTPGPAGEAAEPPPSPGDGVLDLDQFDGLRQLATTSLDPSFLPGLVDQYLEDAVAQLTVLKAAAQRRDAAGQRSAAHGLKGSSATMGATAMAAACAVLESAARDGVVAEQQDVVRISAELERAAAALRAQVLDQPEPRLN